MLILVELSHGQVGIRHLIMLLLFNLQICWSKWSDQNLLTAANNGVPVKEANIPIPTSWKCNVKVEKLSHTADLFVGYFVLSTRIQGLDDGTNEHLYSWKMCCWIYSYERSIVIYWSFNLTLSICYFACWCMIALA